MKRKRTNAATVARFRAERVDRLIDQIDKLVEAAKARDAMIDYMIGWLKECEQDRLTAAFNRRQRETSRDKQIGLISSLLKADPNPEQFSK